MGGGGCVCGVGGVGGGLVACGEGRFGRKGLAWGYEWKVGWAGVRGCSCADVAPVLTLMQHGQQQS